jgi:hypothetical protein
MNFDISASHSKHTNFKGFLFDLIIYISIIFLVRELTIPHIGFLANGLFWSFTALIVATWRMRARHVSWKELGLRKPKVFSKRLEFRF